jgi:hypothetical protein
MRRGRWSRISQSARQFRKAHEKPTWTQDGESLLVIQPKKKTSDIAVVFEITLQT